MTRYELKQKQQTEKDNKKQLKKLKRKERRLARKEKRQAKRKLRKDKRLKKRFLKKSNAKYGFWDRLLVKTFRMGGPLLAFGYISWQVYDKLFLGLRGEDMIGAMDLETAVALLVGSMVVFFAALWYGTKWIKKAATAQAVARNQGLPSLYYSPLVITSIRFVLGGWFFGMLYLFNYIGVTYGEALNNGFMYMAYAYVGGFVSLMIGDMIEQSILKAVRNQEHEAEDETREMIYNLTHPEEE